MTQRQAPQTPPAGGGTPAPTHESGDLGQAQLASLGLAADATPEAVDEADFPLSTADGRRFRYLPLRNTNKKFNPVTAPTMHYPLWGDPVSGAVRSAPFDGGVEVHDQPGFRLKRSMRCSASSCMTCSTTCAGSVSRDSCTSAGTTECETTSG